MGLNEARMLEWSGPGMVEAELGKELPMTVQHRSQALSPTQCPRSCAPGGASGPQAQPSRRMAPGVPRAWGHGQRAAAILASVMTLALVQGGCPGDEAVVTRPRSLAAPTVDPDAPARRVVLPARADHALSEGKPFVRLGWGQGDAEVGRSDEGRMGPAAITVAPDGTLLLLDPVNRRVLRFAPDGRPAGSLSGVAETAMDLVPSVEGAIALVYVPGETPGFRLDVLSRTGVAQTWPLPSGLELVTGLFAVGDAASPDLWIEERHDLSTRVVTGGKALASGQAPLLALGRPHLGRPGHHVTALKTGPRSARVLGVVPGQTTYRILEAETPQPLVSIMDLATHASGTLYLTVFLSDEGGPPDYAWSHTRLVLLVLPPSAAEPFSVELHPGMASEAHRSFAVGPDGSFYQLHTTAEAATVFRFHLPLGTEVRP